MIVLIDEDRGGQAEAGNEMGDLPDLLLARGALIGRLLMVNLTPADVSNSAGALTILAAIRKRWPWLKHLVADADYDRTKLMDKAASLTSSWRSSAVPTPRGASRSSRDAGSWSAPSAG